MRVSTASLFMTCGKMKVTQKVYIANNLRGVAEQLTTGVLRNRFIMNTIISIKPKGSTNNVEI